MKTDEKTINPSKPQKYNGFFEYTIKLNKKQVSYGGLKSKKELQKFREQTDRHITIVGDKASEKIEKALNKFSEKQKAQKLKKIKAVFNKCKWRYSERDVYLITKKTYWGNPKVLVVRKSYIRMIEMPDVKIFFNKVNSILETRIPIQVPHITLFTLGKHPGHNYYGISVPSKNALRRLNPKKIKIYD